MQEFAVPDPAAAEGHQTNADPLDPSSEVAIAPTAGPRPRRTWRWLGYAAVVAMFVLAGLGAHSFLAADPVARASVLVTPLIGNPYSPSSSSLLNIETEVQLVTSDDVSLAAAAAMGMSSRRQ